MSYYDTLSPEKKAHWDQCIAEDVARLGPLSPAQAAVIRKAFNDPAPSDALDGDDFEALREVTEL